jgi:tRNA modification GTPase
VAIESPVQGTTRDTLSTLIDIKGFTVELIDTAGEESARDEIGTTAQSHRASASKQADLILSCVSSDANERGDDGPREMYTQPTLRLLTKADLLNRDDLTSSSQPFDLAVSARSEQGLDELKELIRDQLTEGESSAREMIGSTAARCRDSLIRAEHSLSTARDAAQQGLGDELIALELRNGLDELGKIAGAVYTDDLLDRIFSRFCIGK